MNRIAAALLFLLLWSGAAAAQCVTGNTTLSAIKSEINQCITIQTAPGSITPTVHGAVETDIANFAGTAPGSNGQFIYNSSGTYAGFALGSGLFSALGIALNAASGLPGINGAITTGDLVKWSATGIQDAGVVPSAPASTTLTSTGACAASSITATASIYLVTAVMSTATACAGTTMTIASFAAQTHGWVCDAHDITTPGDVVVQTAYTTTSASFNATTGTGDSVVIKCGPL